ncbi:glycosyltransferase family 2 protein [Rubellimicrobium rubrum]|uniref:Glycosyltransferase family 2 protein n=1 Tax=Rubellimicrobium rubrum TaxID=2585369 RepID=A0A5C4MTS0_9RHOB|nr:glycosyltransferase family 2 protein [Rubellimicrobium rubrum]TNC49440.1 glycosyltransferase family 2 protein [Rubellimicrobium rubrum]
MIPLRVSVILPAKDEEGCIAAVVADIGRSLADIVHEIIVIDDGSTDATAARVRAMMPTSPNLRLLRHDRACGQSAAIRTGVLAARADLVATLDADGQNPPAELVAVLAPFLKGRRDPRLGLVQGQRAARQDALSRRLASRMANRLRARLLVDGLRDSACGLKAFPREVYLRLPYFDHIHRFMAAMVLREGFTVLPVEVSHAPRLSGRSKYGNLGRAMVGVVDLLGTVWLLRRRKLPSALEVVGEDRGAATWSSPSLPRGHETDFDICAGPVAASWQACPSAMFGRPRDPRVPCMAAPVRR